MKFQGSQRIVSFVLLWHCLLCSWAFGGAYFEISSSKYSITTYDLALLFYSQENSNNTFIQQASMWQFLDDRSTSLDIYKYSINHLDKNILTTDFKISNNPPIYGEIKYTFPNLSILSKSLELEENCGIGKGISLQVIQKTKEKKVEITEEYFKISHNHLFFYGGKILEHSSVIRIIIHPESKEEVVFSGRTLKKYLQKIIEQGKCHTEKDKIAKEKLAIVEIQIDLSKTRRCIFPVYISQDDLPKEISLD